MNDPQIALIGFNAGTNRWDSCIYPSDNPVDVWQFDLDLVMDEVTEFERVLSPDERARANRFKHADDRDR
jgi:hypothetical protein